MKVTPSEIEKYIKLLEETTRRIANASKGVDDAHLLPKPDKKSWSANDILVHVRSCADVWG